MGEVVSAVVAVVDEVVAGEEGEAMVMGALEWEEAGAMVVGMEGGFGRGAAKEVEVLAEAEMVAAVDMAAAVVLVEVAGSEGGLALVEVVVEGSERSDGGVMVAVGGG